MAVTHQDPNGQGTPQAVMLSRRTLVVGSALLMAGGVRPVFAKEQGPPDVGVYCEPTLAPSIGAVGLMFKRKEDAPVAVLTAPADLILLQVMQNPAEDLLILPAASMDQAAMKKFIDPSSRWDAWKNGLVLGARAGDGTTSAGAGDLQKMLATGRVAATDPTPASTLDGVGLLGRLGLAEGLAGRILGVANTADAAYLVQTGVARYGLMYATDVRANPALEVAAVLDPAVATPIVFAVALNVKPRSRNARTFLDFLRTPDAAARLHHDGLEPV